MDRTRVARLAASDAPQCADLADKLGVGHRTVGRWEADGANAGLRPDSQAVLDTMLTRADISAQQRFLTLLREAADENPGDSLRGVDFDPTAAIGGHNDAKTATQGLHRPWETVLTAATLETAPMSAPHGAEPYDDEVEDVHRRRFLQSLAALGTSSLTGPEALRHELFSATGGDAADLTEWEAIAWEYGSTYAATPPLDLMGQLATDMVVAREQLGRARTDLQRRGLQRVIAQLAAYTAQTAGNLGNRREAVRWWRAARQAADASAHAEIRVWVRGREIVRGMYEHRPVDYLLNLADEALAITDRPGVGTGSVMSGRAQALAMSGRAAEARAALADLYEMVDRLPSRVRTDVESMYGWPEYRLRHTESLVFTHIGDLVAAEAAQDQALTLYPAGFFRERTQVQLHRAQRLIRGGEPVAGAADACAALDGLPEGHRIEVVLEVARWAAAVVPATEHRRTEVGELLEMLALPAVPTI